MNRRALLAVLAMAVFPYEAPAQQVARLRGPVGLSIGSRTPPEIAVAILADLIASRNGIVLEKAEKDAARRRA